MIFMVIVKATKESEAGAPPDPELLAEHGKYNEELMKAGVLLDLSGLQSSSKGARIKYSNGKRVAVVDGPFAETKELIAGYWIIQVKSREEALEWAKRAPAPHETQDCEIELRQFFELDDFSPSEAIDRHRELGKQLEGKK